MLDPDIWKTISEDGASKDDYTPDLINDLWMGAFIDDDCIGLFSFHSVTGVTLQLHVQILPEYRKDHSMEAMGKIWDWFLESVDKAFVKVTVSIPVIYQNVYKFALANGFKDEGLNRTSFKKNGQIVDQWLLGITREEIKGQTHGRCRSNSRSR